MMMAWTFFVRYSSFDLGFDFRWFVFDEMIGDDRMAGILEHMHDEVAARVGLGRAGIATGNDHAPDGAGCMGFVFVMRGSTTHGLSLQTF